MKSVATLVVAAVLAVFCVSSVHAKKLNPALMATTKEKFDDQAAAIRQQMKPGGHWQFVEGDDRTLVENRLNLIAEVFAQASSVGDLDAQAKAKVVTAQEEVNAVLTQQDGRRLICAKASPTGSHRVQTQCVTYAEQERERRESQRYLRSNEVNVN